MKKLRNNTWFILIIALITVVNIAGWILFTQQSRRGIDARFDTRRERANPDCLMAKKLGFDEQQTAQFNQINAEHRQGMREERRALAETRQQLVATALAEDEQEEAVDRLIENLGQKHQRRYRRQVQHMNQVQQICHPEQRMAYREFMQKMSKRRPEQMERRGNRSDYRQDRMMRRDDCPYSGQSQRSIENEQPRMGRGNKMNN